MIRYYKLFDLLNRRGMKKTDLLDVISSPTLAKISKGENIQTDVIDKICLHLGCQPSDIMEVIEDEISNEKITGTVEVLKTVLSKEEQEEVAKYEQNLFENDDTLKVSTYLKSEEKNKDFAEKIKKTKKKKDKQ